MPTVDMVGMSLAELGGMKFLYANCLNLFRRNVLKRRNARQAYGTISWELNESLLGYMPLNRKDTTGITHEIVTQPYIRENNTA